MIIGEYTFDDELVSSVLSDGRPRVRVYPITFRAVVLGRGSRPEIELRAAACREDGIEILRRSGGGCAVFLDPGNLVVSLALAVDGIGLHRAWFGAISGWLIDGLTSAGVKGISIGGVSDLILSDRKVGGSCIHRSKGLLYYSAAILVEPDVGAMERYLEHPPREPAYRRGRTHRDFVAGVSGMGKGISVPGLCEALGEGLDAGDVLSRLGTK